MPLDALVQEHTIWAKAAIVHPWRAKPEINSQYSEDSRRGKERDLGPSWHCLTTEVTPEPFTVDFLWYDMVEPVLLVGTHCVHLPILH